MPMRSRLRNKSSTTRARTSPTNQDKNLKATIQQSNVVTTTAGARPMNTTQQSSSTLSTVSSTSVPFTPNSTMPTTLTNTPTTAAGGGGTTTTTRTSSSFYPKMILILSILLTTIAFVTAKKNIIPTKQLELNNNNNSNNNNNHTSKIPEIGDQQRSNTSSSSFFQSVDSDGDGLLERFELAHFLKEIIGGSSFDEKEEVDQGVKDVMDKLDIGGDDGLDVNDILNHWSNLEKLLGVEETAEWMEHAVQMPEDVVRKFQENGVTGFDFPELVEDNGKLIFEDLQISSERFRSKIVRLIRARMLGIGSEPTTPTKVSVTLKDCSVIILDWESSIAEGFPVHKYRVQRRILDGTERGSMSSSNSVAGNGSSSSHSNSENDVDDSSSSSSMSTTTMESINDILDWETIHINSKTTKMDTVFPGYKYSYRIEAWNAAGRSEWHVVDVEKKRKKLKCKAPPSRGIFDHSRGGSGGSGSSGDGHHDDSMSMQSILTMLTFVCGVASYIFSQLIQFWQIYRSYERNKKKNRKGMTNGGGEDIDQPISPLANAMITFQNFVNRFSMKMIGIEIFPSHDIEVDTSGMENVDGYHKISTEDNSKTTPLSFQRQRRKVSIGSGTIPENFIPMCTPCPTIYSMNESSSRPSSERGPKKPKKIRMKKNTKKFIKKITTSFGSDSSSTSISSVTIDTRPVTTVARQEFLRMPSEDVRSCAFCGKKYGKIKRVRHDCSKCARTFCHKCGYCSHSNIFPCQVPGSCLCPDCKGT